MASMSSSSLALAQWVVRPRPTPADVADLLRICLLDFVGLAAFGGRFGESSPAIRAVVEGSGDATVVGERDGVPMRYAALLNGAYAHTLDFDDTHAAAGLHPGAPVIAAVLAEAERLAVDGTTFLAGLASGYEACCRVGASCTPAAYERGFHLTSVAGIFGGVAGVARVSGVEATTLEAAFGFAGSRAAGSMQYLANGAWNKRYHPGFAAHDALMVLAIARAGGRGATDAFDGRYGVFHAYTPDPARERLTDGLGDTWLMLETAIKPYPSCRLTHGAIDAALALRPRLPGSLDAARVTVRLSPTAVRIVGVRDAAKITPANIVDGQFSVYFQAADTLIHGTPAWSSYDRIGDAAVEALAARTTVIADSGFGATECELTVEVDGRVECERVAEPLGEPSRPIGWDDAVVKFMTLAGPVFGEDHARRIAARVATIEEVDDMAAFARLLRPEEDRP